MHGTLILNTEYNEYGAEGIIITAKDIADRFVWDEICKDEFEVRFY